MTQMTEFQHRAAGAALERLLSGGYFDITALRKIAALIGAELHGADVVALEALHCVDYSKMDRVLAQQVREKCLEVLGLPPQVINAEPVGREEKPKEEASKRLRLAFWR